MASKSGGLSARVLFAMLTGGGTQHLPPGDDFGPPRIHPTTLAPTGNPGSMSEAAAACTATMSTTKRRECLVDRVLYEPYRPDSPRSRHRSRCNQVTRCRARTGAVDHRPGATVPVLNQSKVGTHRINTVP